jgi:general nucleoside transport system ATP-binding protein
LSAQRKMLFEARGISRSFPGCLANDDISLSIGEGEIHALLGENGAGKSTLVSIMYGVLEQDSGSLMWAGEPLEGMSPARARQLGIGMVFQHFSLFESLSVLENIALTMDQERDMQRLSERIIDVSKSYGLPLDPKAHVFELSVGERQRIEIVRCLLQDPKLLILDEPTSVLTPQEVGRLFVTLRQLSDEGCAILYISHKLEEVRALCHGATVLRQGRVVGECEPAKHSTREIAEMMIGATLSPPTRQDISEPGSERLSISQVTLGGKGIRKPDLENVSLSVRGGEIIGIAGVAGNGQKELMAVLSGEKTLDGEQGSIKVDDIDVSLLGPKRRRRHGMAFVPEKRNGHAAVPELALFENGFLTAKRSLGLSARGLINSRATRQFAGRIIDGFDVRTTGAEADAGSLSGGNMQKFIVGREIFQEPGVLVVSQPTWGVDPGAAQAIHRSLMDLAENGAAIVVISQDLDEIFALCGSVAVLSEGKLSEVRKTGDVNVEEIGLLMGGLHDLGAAS